jgi:hypothetical protein
MSRSKAVKARVRENRSKRKLMAWKHPILRLFSMISTRGKLTNNSRSGAHVSANYQKGVLYQAISDDPQITAIITESMDRRRALYKILREATHHSQAKETLDKLRSML